MAAFLEYLGRSLESLCPPCLDWLAAIAPYTWWILGGLGVFLVCSAIYLGCLIFLGLRLLDTHAATKRQLPRSKEFASVLETYDRRDYASAARHLRRLADQENAMAQNSLGILHESGLLGEHNDDMAESWYRKAAAQGLSSAQFNLAAIIAADLFPFRPGDPIHHSPKAVPEAERADRLAEGYMWALLAARQGHKAAKVALKRMRKEMTPELIVDAERRALEKSP